MADVFIRDLASVRPSVRRPGETPGDFLVPAQDLKALPRGGHHRNAEPPKARCRATSDLVRFGGGWRLRVDGDLRGEQLSLCARGFDRSRAMDPGPGAVQRDGDDRVPGRLGDGSAVAVLPGSGAVAECRMRDGKSECQSVGVSECRQVALTPDSRSALRPLLDGGGFLD